MFNSKKLFLVVKYYLKLFLYLTVNNSTFHYLKNTICNFYKFKLKFFFQLFFNLNTIFTTFVNS